MMMNRRHFWGFVLLTAAMLLSGCSAEILDGGSQGLVPIELTASVTEGAAEGGTRAGTALNNSYLPNNTTFTVGFSENTTLGSNTTTYKTTSTTGATKCTGTQPYFTLTGASTTVYAYYPSKPGSTFSVQTAQNDDNNYRSSDLMYATKSLSKTSPTATADLNFGHKMAKIIVNATLGSGITSITTVKIVGGYRTVNVSNTTTCTLGTTLTNPNSSTNITVFSDNHTSGTLSCAALIPPQTVSGNFLQIDTNAGTVTYSLNGKDFASNNVYTFNVTLTSSQAGTTVAITDWADNGNATVTVGGGGSLSLDQSSMTLVYGGNTGSLAVSGSVTLSGSGTTSFTATSSDPSVATVSLNKTTITVTPAATGAAVGTTTITVTDGNNNDNTATCLVTVNRPAGALLSEATSGHVGYVVGFNGRLYATLSDLNTDNTTAVGVLAYCGSTGHGLIISLVDATNQAWDTINGWVTSSRFDGKYGKMLPDAAARGSLASYTQLGSTTVSDWIVLWKDDYTMMWNAFGGATNGTWNSTSNGYITAAGGTGCSGSYWSNSHNYGSGAWSFYSDGWNFPSKSYSYGVRPVLAF